MNSVIEVTIPAKNSNKMLVEGGNLLKTFILNHFIYMYELGKYDKKALTTFIKEIRLNGMFYVIQGIYFNIAPLSSSMISCGEGMIGKFTATNIIKPVQFTDKPELTHREREFYIGSGRSRSFAVIFLLYLLYRTITEIKNGTVIYCTFVPNNGAYEFYYNHIKKYNLATINHRYVNINTSVQLDSIIFNIHDLRGKFLDSYAEGSPSVIEDISNFILDSPILVLQNEATMIKDTNFINTLNSDDKIRAFIDTLTPKPALI
jgi:hypothetical protein